MSKHYTDRQRLAFAMAYLINENMTDEQLPGAISIILETLPSQRDEADAGLRQIGIEPEGSDEPIEEESEFIAWDPSLDLPCPVPDCTDVTVKLRNGETFRHDCPECWQWGPLNYYESPEPGEIVGYRVHKSEVKK